MVNPGLSKLRRSILFCDFVPPVLLSVVLDLALSPALSGWRGGGGGGSGLGGALAVGVRP